MSREILSSERNNLTIIKRAGLVLGGLMLTGLVVDSMSDSLNTYCEVREQFAPGGNASPAAPCDANEVFRARIEHAASTMADAFTPEFRPLFSLEM
ncbi:MAG TPA: hypothetical protein VD735_02370 [Candidatus Saccharimonadales bacterium]|nr:hypothetical protein [Candidatus Saccharimonadales bacterium]